MADPHLSIGEVLSLLQDGFPDITISKIRFLESQGLIDPERTPSGYRKFYEADIERLRWILTQQKENFLPLKVIKDRLANGDPDGSGGSAGPTADAGPQATTANPPVAPSQGATGSGGPRSDGRPDQPAGPSDSAATASSVRASMPAGEAPARPEPIWMADLARNRSDRDRPDADGGRGGSSFDRGPSEVSLTAAELVAAAGISRDALRELEQFGLLAGRALGDDTYYDGDALIVARKAAAFLGHGIGARHLRMFKVAAEREAGFLEQVAMPLLKQRNPEARRQAVDLVEELVELGDELRAALLRAKLRHHLDRA